MHIVNAGVIVSGFGFVYLGAGNDIFTNFKKVGGVIKNGTVDGLIDLNVGADTFNGGANAETVRDGGGADTYKFGGGNDTYLAVKTSGGADGADIVDGGKGVDTYDGSFAGGLLTVNLTTHAASGAVGSDKVTGFENVIGTNGGANVLTGSSAANSLTGGSSGDDLTGLGGRDILTGGGGFDTFHFLSLTDSGTKASARDLITDFTQGNVFDVIDLGTIDAKTGAVNPGDDDFDFIGVSNFSGTKGELRESYSGGNTIVSGDVNGDGKADFSIALKGHLLLTNGDFLL